MPILARSLAAALWGSWVCAHVRAEGDIIPDFMLDTALGAQVGGEYVEPPSSGAISLISWKGKKSSKERATKLCEVPAEDYKQMPHCEDEKIDGWREKGKHGKWAWWDKKKGEIVVGNGFEKECKGKDKNIQRKVDGVIEKFLCKEKCDSKGEVYRLGCCIVCIQKKQDGSTKKNKGRRVLDIECEGCEEDEMERIFEQNREKCQKDDDGKIIHCKLDEDKECRINDDVIKPREDVCVATDCDGCPDDSAAKAQCCALCLEHSCKTENEEGTSTGDNDKKRVCTGCGEVLADEKDGEPTPKPNTTPKPQDDGSWDPVKIALIVLGIIIVLIAVAALAAFLHKKNQAGRGGYAGGGGGAHYGGGAYPDDRFRGPSVPPPGYGPGYAHHPSTGYSGGAPPSATYAGGPPSAGWQGAYGGAAPPSAMHPGGTGGYRTGGPMRPGQGVRVEMTVRR